MPLEIDPQIARAVEPLLAALSGKAPPAVGDIEARRELAATLMASGDQSVAADVQTREVTVVADDGAELPARWYTRGDDRPGSAALYLHGGGMILGDVDLYDVPVAQYVSRSGTPILSVGYRAAPEHPQPVPLRDAYAGLTWLTENADELGVDGRRIAVMGDSAGAGLAAGVTILARERGGPVIARQILLFAMLDDRNQTPDEQIEAVAFSAWTYADNLTAWAAALGDRAGTPSVATAEAPGRLEDATGLPPAYIEVGDIDILRDENVRYALTLLAAGVPTELHVRPGAPHGFDLLAPDANVTRRALDDRVRVLSAL